MWIAFRIQYLWYQQQLFKRVQITNNCCELLSEFSIFDTNNNRDHYSTIHPTVVNCFQNSVSLIPTTTFYFNVDLVFLLWIAFRIQYLWYQQQLSNNGLLILRCCELLSEFSIFDTNNNCHTILQNIQAVVNCFQNSVSLIPTTTNYYCHHLPQTLWIAFRIQYLWYQQQQ